MCLAIVSTEDHLSTMALDGIRCKEEKRCQRQTRADDGRESRKRKEMKQDSKRLISSGGDLALDESGRNLGTECGKSPSCA